MPKRALQSLPITQGAMTKWINAIDLVGTEEDDDPATVELVPEPET